jgi:hypothetical protein
MLRPPVALMGRPEVCSQPVADLTLRHGFRRRRVIPFVNGVVTNVWLCEGCECFRITCLK